VALYEDTALVGAPSASDARQMFAGAAYLYVRSGTTWTEQQRLRSRFSSEGLSFGKAIALSADTGIVGSSGVDTGGAALVFVPQAPNGTPCDWPTSCQSGYCIDGVCCNSACGNGTKGDCQACLKSETGLATDGLCGPIVAVAAAVVCRPSAGSCDIPESCDGVSAACPDDSFAAKGTECTFTEFKGASGRCRGSEASCPLVSNWVDPYAHQTGCSCSLATTRSSTPISFLLSLLAVALLLRRRRPIGKLHAASDETNQKTLITASAWKGGVPSDE
jgi:MYXO-CTERM domain-containing protein